jgi:putative hydrolase of the HAD superfamily
MELAGILFDLDNTLVDRPASLVRYATLFAEEFADQLGEIPQDMLTQVIQQTDGGGYTLKEDMLQELLSLLPWHDPPSLSWLRDHWYTHSTDCATPMDGLVEMLDGLSQRALRLGIVTNGTTTGQNRKIDLLGLRPYMDCIVISESAGYKKPDRRIFEQALNGLALSAAATGYVGDHPINDILGSAAAGLTSIWLRGSHPWPVQGIEPVLQIGGLAELVPLLDDETES